MVELQRMVSGKLGGENSSICRPNNATYRPGNSGGDLLESFLCSSMGYVLESGTMRG